MQKQSEWLPKYVFYALLNNYKKGGTRQFENKTTGLHNLKTDDYVSGFEIAQITLEQQIDICNKLDIIRKLISIKQLELEKFDLLIKARFVEMFGDLFVNSLGWSIKPLSSVIVNANNGMARRGNDKEGYIVLRLVELQDGYINYDSPNRILLTDKEKQRYLLKDNDFLFARVNGNPLNVGRCAVFKDIGEDVYHNDHIIRVHFDEDQLDGCYASYMLNSDYGKRQMANQIKTSAGQYTISQDGIGVIESVLPPIELQKRFATFVQQVDKSKLNELFVQDYYLFKLFLNLISTKYVESIANEIVRGYSVKALRQSVTKVYDEDK